MSSHRQRVIRGNERTLNIVQHRDESPEMGARPQAGPEAANPARCERSAAQIKAETPDLTLSSSGAPETPGRFSAAVLGPAGPPPLGHVRPLAGAVNTRSFT